MISKLGVIHFTAIASFAHLLSLRGERKIPSKIVIFFLCPYFIWAQYGLALCVLAMGHIVVRFQGNIESLKKSLQRGPTLLFGHIDHAPIPSRTEAANSQPQPTHDTQRDIAKERSLWKLIGRILVAMFFLAQCVGSIILYTRRKRHDALAMTLIDQRAMDLAVGGLLVAILTLIHLIWKPEISPGDISRMASIRTYLDVALLQILNLPETPHLVPDYGINDELDDLEKILHSPLSKTPWTRIIATTGTTRFFISSLMSSILLCSLESRYVSAIWRMCNWFATEGPESTRWTLLAMGLLLALLWMCGAVPSTLPRHSYFALMRAVPLHVMAYTLCLLFISSPLLNIFIICMEIFVISLELERFPHWPTDKACPELWQDPYSSFLWSL